MCVTTDCGRCGGPLVRFSIAVGAGVVLAGSSALTALLAALNAALWTLVAVEFAGVIPAAVVLAVMAVRFYSRPAPVRTAGARAITAGHAHALPARAPLAIEPVRVVAAPAVLAVRNRDR